jgi:hypothetical protein
MIEKIENKKASVEPINLIIGIMMVLGGVLYLLNQSALGGLIVGVGIVIELLIKYISKLV